MSDDINYSNSPLHGLSLKNLLIEVVDHYGFEILFAYLNINCFKTNPSIESSVKFLKKTDWAREKVEGFYLYEFKNLPKASRQQFELPPRDRIIPEDQVPREPATLSLEDAQRLRDKRAIKAAARGQKPWPNSKQDKKDRGFQNRKAAVPTRNSEKPFRAETSSFSTKSTDSDNDPWANSRKLIKDKKLKD